MVAAHLLYTYENGAQELETPSQDVPSLAQPMVIVSKLQHTCDSPAYKQRRTSRLECSGAVRRCSVLDATMPGRPRRGPSDDGMQLRRLAAVQAKCMCGMAGRASVGWSPDVSSPPISPGKQAPPDLEESTGIEQFSPEDSAPKPMQPFGGMDASGRQESRG
eukprot:jgi/Tetstr1/441775/TSEL_029992.t1